MYELLLFALSIFAGCIGAILGLGGGIIIVPVLTLLLHVDIRYAIAASLVSIIATSSGAASNFLKSNLTNLRVASFLELGTVFGAITGFLISSYIHGAFLYFLFAGFLVFSAIMMFRQRQDIVSTRNHSWADRLGLASSYPGPGQSKIDYKVERVPLGLFFMYFAGILSALLGIGSGVLKVLAMDNAMRLPIKVSSATSNFMIGVTAVASAGAYFVRGDIKPPIVVPVALGIIVGSWFGARAMKKLNASTIRVLFIVIMLIVAAQMIYKGFHV